MVFSKVFVVWGSLKTFHSKVLASFADHHYLPCSVISSRCKETVMASFQLEKCVQFPIAPTTWLTHH